MTAIALLSFLLSRYALPPAPPAAAPRPAVRNLEPEPWRRRG